MKKLVALLLALIALTTCLSVYAVSFKKVTLWCDSTSDSAYEWLSSQAWNSGKNKGSVCVYHSVAEADTNHNFTNHFRVYVGSNTSASANKWIAPKSNIRISTNAITKNCNVKIKARGNTKWAAWDMDFDRITVSGSYGLPK